MFTCYLLSSARSRRELVDGSIVIFASVDRGTVKVSKYIDNHPIVGKAAIRRTLEGVNNSLSPVAANRTQLENSATAQATFTCGPIEVAGLVKNKVTERTIAVWSLLEAVNQVLRPFSYRLWRQFVNGANSISSTIISRAVNVT